MICAKRDDLDAGEGAFHLQGTNSLKTQMGRR